MRVLGLVLAMAVVVMGRQAEAIVAETVFTQVITVPGGPLQFPTAMAWAPDGSNRLFVTRKQGEIRIVKDGKVLPTPFAVVSPLVSTGECGVTGIAFDPAFLVTQHVYVMACVSPTEQQIIRYTVSGDEGVQKTVVVGKLPTVGANHDGGGLGFGPDGKLYWSIGDLGNGTGVNADLISSAAKVSRANLDGTPVPDNPFFDGPGPNADFTWARGFRNPFTLTFQPATGLLWVNDVGAGYEQIYVVRKGDHAGFSMYQNNQPAGFITPVIKYKTNGTDYMYVASPAMNGAIRKNGIATITTTTPHGFRRGERIVIDGVMDVSFKGAVYVIETPTPTTFTALLAGPDSMSGGGVAVAGGIGGCVTGGTFYDSTAFPTSHRGNFFFGEFNNQKIMRAVLDPASNEVAAVETWANGIGQVVDVALGPDGALYSIEYASGYIYRASYNVPAPGLIVTPTNIWIGDGEPAAVMVRLASQPPAGASVSVSTKPGVGDGDVRVLSGEALTFTDSTWHVPQRMTVGSGFDVDSSDDVGSLTVSAPGLPSETVTVHARDQAGPDLVLSTMTLVLEEGGSGNLTVGLSRQPAIDLTVTVARTQGAADVSVSSGASLTFTPATWNIPQSVTVSAEDHAQLGDRSASILIDGSGLTPRTVTVTVRNVGASPPVDGSAGGGTDGGIARDGNSDSDAPGDAGTSSDKKQGCGCRLGDVPGQRDGAVWLVLALIAAGLRRSLRSRRNND